MKKLSLLLFVLTSLSISCNKSGESVPVKKTVALPKYDKNGLLIVYNEAVFSQLWSKNRNLKVTVIDTFCIGQTKKAKADIQKRKLTYFMQYRLENKEMSKLLAKYGIATKEFYPSCVRMGGFEPYCYQQEMNTAIQLKLTQEKMDSLWEVARKEFIVAHSDEAYMEDGVDLRAKYLKK